MFPDLDAAYERQLEAMARVRRAVATVATSRKKLELRLDEIQQEPTEGEGGAGTELAEVRRQLDAARAEERRNVRGEPAAPGEGQRAARCEGSGRDCVCGR